MRYHFVVDLMRCHFVVYFMRYHAVVYLMRCHSVVLDYHNRYDSTATNTGL